MAPRVDCYFQIGLLLRAEFLRRDCSGGAVLIRIFYPSPKGTRLILPALGRVKISEVKLRHSCRYRFRRFGNQRVVRVDSLRITAGLMIEARERQFGEIGKIAIPRIRGSLQFSFSRGILPQFRVGDSLKVARLGALREHAVLLGDVSELLVGSLQPISRSGVNAISSWQSRLRERRSVSIHRGAERSVSGGRTHAPSDERNDDDYESHAATDSPAHNAGPVTAQPADAIGCGLGKFISLKGVTSLSIHGVFFLSFVD
jgi:hypothetical protein